VVPLESDLVTSVDGDGLGGLDTASVALNVLGGNVQDRVVVGRRVDVSTLLVAYTLVLSVDENVPFIRLVHVAVWFIVGILTRRWCGQQRTERRQRGQEREQMRSSL
jgi:hypothetical protein